MPANVTVLFNDIEVPFVDGLEIGMSMYHIEYAGQISLPPIQDPGIFYPYYPDNYVMMPSNEEAAAYLHAANAPPEEVANALATIGTNPLYAVVDVRRTNLGFNEFKGYDLFVNYTFDASFGTLWTSFNGTYVDTATNQPNSLSPKIERAGIDSSQMNAVLSAGAYIGDNISVRGSLNYQPGRSGFLDNSGPLRPVHLRRGRLDGGPVPLAWRDQRIRRRPADLPR